jgi:chromosome segregation ATPase
MLRKSNNTQPVSNKEELALNFEARKATAEGEFLIICEDKKRVLQDIEDLNKDIEKKDDELKQKESILEKIQDDINKISLEFLEEQRKLSDLSIEGEKIKNEFDIFTSSVDSETKKLNRGIKKLRDSLSTEKEKSDEEIKDLIAKKDSLTEELNFIVSNISNHKKIEDQEIIKLDKLQVEIGNLKLEILSSKDEISKLEKYKQDQDIFISSKQTKISEYDSIIDQKKLAIEKLDGEITKKTQEYNEVEALAFSILQKQEVLNQKEAFIKSRYERSGIKYE